MTDLPERHDVDDTVETTAGSAGPAAATHRTDVPTGPGERSALLTMLDYVRETATWKVEGLGDADAQRAPLPTSPLTSPAGLVNHLRWVEHSWLETRFAGGPSRGPWTVGPRRAAYSLTFLSSQSPFGDRNVREYPWGRG